MSFNPRSARRPRTQHVAWRYLPTGVFVPSTEPPVRQHCAVPSTHPEALSGYCPRWATWEEDRRTVHGVVTFALCDEHAKQGGAKIEGR